MFMVVRTSACRSSSCCALMSLPLARSRSNLIKRVANYAWPTPSVGVDFVHTMAEKRIMPAIVSRALGGAAIVIVVLHVLVLWRLGTSSQGVLWSNALQLFSSAAAAGAYAYASARSRGFTRRFCWLASCSFVLWSTAQSGWMYYEYSLRAVVPTVSPINVLFFFFVAPLGVAILLPSERQKDEGLATFFLDFLQLGTVLLTAYLYFFYAPSFWAGRPGELNQAIRHASEWRNWILTSALVVRAVLSSPGAIRNLFARMALVLAVYSAGESLFFNWTAASVINSGKWFDLTWSASFALAIFFAASTEVEEPGHAPGRTERLRFNIAFHLMPALIPVLVLITAARIVQYQLVIAASAVLLSFACYSLRLFISQLQAQKAAAALHKSEQIFRALASGVSSGTGKELFESLALYISQTLGTTYVYIGEMREASAGAFIRTLAAAKNGQIIPNFEYKLNNAPCEAVIGKQQLCFYRKGVANLFPLHHLLFGMESYMGAPLVGVSGAILGVLAVVREKQLRNPELTEAVLQICAARVATELERTRAEEARRTSEQVFSLAFRQSSNVMMLLKPLGNEPLARVMDINDAGLALWGGTREEIIGKTAPEIAVASGESPLKSVFWAYEADRMRFWKELRQNGKVVNREVLVRRRSGEIKNIVLNADLFLIKGEPWVFTSGRDITDEKAAQEALTASETKYRDLFENANDFIFTATPQGTFLALNKTGQMLCGLSPTEALRARITDTLETESAAIYGQCTAELLRTLRPTTCEVTLRRGAAGVATLELSLRPILENGSVTGVQGIGRDVTERRTLEKKLLQSQKMEAVGTLAGGIAHDFNNLLTVITGYSQLARDRVSGDNQVSDDLEQIQHAAHRAAGLTGQLLAFSRNHVAQRTALNLNDSVRAMEKMLKRVIGEDIELETKLDPAIAPILADPGQIDQIIMNLAANARDAMKSGGQLRFVTSNLRLQAADARLALSAGDYVVLTVKDSGVGMDQATISRIFEPFFTTKEVGKGTGLGLSTVYGIVQQAGGNIAVVSEPGRGASFNLYFPVTERGLESEAQPQLEPSVHGKETILLIEDDAPLLALAQRVLESAGYTVYGAPGVEEAVRILQEISRDFDLVVTDVVMAGGGGVEFVKKLQHQRPDTKVLFMSGYTDGKVPREYLEGEHPAFLAKPFEPVQLAKKVRRLLDSKAAQPAFHTH